MAEFETVKSEVRDFGAAGFIAVERKRVKTDDKQNDFILIARGFYLRDGTARRRNFVTLPANDPEVRKFIAAALEAI